MANPSVTIDVTLVRNLIRNQFPAWSDLPVEPVAAGGWDNRTFHLGDEMSVRLPSAAWYAAQVDKEQEWLPKIAPGLSLAIPRPVAMGVPDKSYPWNWSIYQWIGGEAASSDNIIDPLEFAVCLANFLAELQAIHTGGAPPPGKHNFFRGGSLSVYDIETREALRQLDGKVDTQTLMSIWDSAIESRWQGPDVWFHGDLAQTNLLVKDGQLNAVIDFGCCGVGDPACDLSIAWTLFTGKSREAFRRELHLDEATWKRAQGWTLWKALITLVESIDTNSQKADSARHVINEILEDESGKYA